MYQWNKSEERLNRYAGLLKGANLTFHVYYWGTSQNLTSNVVHKHSFFEVCYVLAGTGLYIEEGVSYSLYEGVLFCSRPNIFHQIKDVDCLDLLYVAFELDENLTMADEFEKYRHNLRHGAVWLEHLTDSPTVFIWKSLLVPKNAEKAAPISVLPQLAHALLASFPAVLGMYSGSEAVSMDSSAALHIHRAKLYIRDNLGSSPTLPEVASYLNLSERHLSRLFAQSIHESFSSLLQKERIRAAEQMLIHTQDPIKEIAVRTGFSSVHYFTRVFTKSKGIPPAAFREAGRQN
ncbi:AraC family transcriptional regulator [Paenibacillus alkaliterrae]|uniref:AraC family transcriptional regulator n=1 Tax=Paenibacillus alkaliterrae TaxID=320909 RepID=UPI001F3E7EFA|nr:AraC family transcriptional regulator [Paenibacillus alkaliterrae]MCF2937915.1 AraC family transcriptional regulator [Paenibacillus alkaliterrae]